MQFIVVEDQPNWNYYRGNGSVGTHSTYVVTTPLISVSCSAKLAYSLGWSVFVSHRSGETTDDFIADLTVALGAGHLKSGSPCRGERVAKYNRLMDIEADLEVKNQKYRYAGMGFGQAHAL
ncbi:MAG: hypothetical protein CL912_18090 [Deltaproteobacteria bacterium]|nr:hypothetical protein [Deltaproteobacteria bacterium]